MPRSIVTRWLAHRAPIVLLGAAGIVAGCARGPSGVVGPPPELWFYQLANLAEDLKQAVSQFRLGPESH